MKIFVINLASSPDRLSFVDNQLKGIGLDYERIDAVDGRLLNRKEMRSNVACVHCYCASKRNLTPGEIGCSLSHIKACREIIKDNLLYACVLEDDVVIDGPKFRKVLGYIEDRLRKEADFPKVFLMSNFAGMRRDKDSIEVERNPPNAWCADGYVLTRSAAQLILRANFPVVSVADVWNRWHDNLGLEIYRVHPAAITQNKADFRSDIGSRTDKSSRLMWLLRVYFINHILSFIDKVMCVLKGQMRFGQKNEEIS